MNSKSVYYGFLLLFLIHDQIKAKPVSGLQSLTRLLRDELEQYPEAEEFDLEDEGTPQAGSYDQKDTELSWNRNSRELTEGQLPDNSLVRIFRNILNSSKRYRGRNKKGSSKGCFGVKLDRIGSLSDLGC
uniref:C-type natriuretic peptide 3 n=1 Tax=Latimeria chalumnae TaxID=7897 RepID=H3AHN0_LATCH|nr:PREDICTED: C-type natriuretic peptide prohormone-like [Latimeria chalumnae]|eukprot:XP_014344174.1 PREDICTED: C-type natriuretic peptide prohormone-like [Latimeria chalumnae]